MKKTKEEEISERSGTKYEQHNYHNSTIYHTHIHINELNMNIKGMLSSRTDEQLDFLKKYETDEDLQQMFGYNASKPENIPTIESFLRSICSIYIPHKTDPSKDGIGTGFLALVPKVGICFLSCGHNFRNVLNCNAGDTIDVLNKCIITFGNFDGKIEKEAKPSFGIRTPMSLKAFLNNFGFYGSIKCGYTMKVFSKGSVAQEPVRVEKDEDYCALLLNGPSLGEVKDKIIGMGLAYLECGYGSYLKYQPDACVEVIGHPYVNGRQDMRVSYGREKKYFNNRIYFDYDSLGGNSGSPVIGRGYQRGSDQAYKVKAIHIEGKEWGESKSSTCGQSIKCIQQWIEH